MQSKYLMCYISARAIIKLGLCERHESSALLWLAHWYSRKQHDPNFPIASLVQLAKHPLSKREVMGSNPIGSCLCHNVFCSEVDRVILLWTSSYQDALVSLCVWFMDMCVYFARGFGCGATSVVRQLFHHFLCKTYWCAMILMLFCCMAPVKLTLLFQNDGNHQFYIVCFTPWGENTVVSLHDFRKHRGLPSWRFWLILSQSNFTIWCSIIFCLVHV